MKDIDLRKIYEAKESIEARFETALKGWSTRAENQTGASAEEFASYIPTLLEELGLAICDSAIHWHDPDKNKKDFSVYFWPGYIDISDRRIALSRPNPFPGTSEEAIRTLSCGVGKNHVQSFFLCPSAYWYKALEKYTAPNSKEPFTPSGTHRWIVDNHRRIDEKERRKRGGYRNISQLEVSALKPRKRPIQGGETIKLDRVSVQLDLVSKQSLAIQLQDYLKSNTSFSPWPFPSQKDRDLNDLCLRLYDIWLAATFNDSTTEEIRDSVTSTLSLLKTSKLQQYRELVGFDEKLHELLKQWVAPGRLERSGDNSKESDYLETHFRNWNSLAITEPTPNTLQTRELGSAMLLSSNPLEPLYLMLLQSWIALCYAAIRSAESAIEERKLGETQVVSAFAHQMKHLSGILAGNWHRPLNEAFEIVPCDPGKLASLGPTGELGTIFTEHDSLLRNSSIFLHYKSLNTAGFLMKLWCMSDTKSDVPFEIYNRPLDLILKDCWVAAVNEMAFFAIGRTLPGPIESTFRQSASDFEKYFDLFEQIFADIDITCWQPGLDLPSEDCGKALPFRLPPPPDTGEDENHYKLVSKFVWFCRLMISLFSDVIKHGDPSKTPKLEIHFEKEDAYKFVLSNHTLLVNGDIRLGTRQDSFEKAFNSMDCVSTQEDAKKLSEMLATMLVRNRVSTAALAPVTGQTVRILCSHELNIDWPREVKQPNEELYSQSFEVDFGRMR